MSSDVHHHTSRGGADRASKGAPRRGVRLGAALLVVGVVGLLLAAPGSGPAESSDFAVSGDAAQGEELYQYACLACHGPEGHAQGRAMPLTLTLERFEPTEVAEIIRDGRGRMPAFGSRFDDGEITDLVAYIATFDEEADPGRVGHLPAEIALEAEPDTVSGERPGMWVIAALGLGPVALIAGLGAVVRGLTGRELDEGHSV